MSIKPKDSASQFIAKQAQKYPKYAKYYEQFEELYDKKYVHVFYILFDNKIK